MKEMYRGNMEGNIERWRPQIMLSGQIENVLIKTDVRSEKNKRACMNRLMNVSQERFVRYVRSVDRSSPAYPNEHPKGMSNSMIINVAIILSRNCNVYCILLLTRWLVNQLQTYRLLSVHKSDKTQNAIKCVSQYVSVFSLANCKTNF